MNGKERCLAVIGGKQPDRIPVFPLLMFLAADRLGVPYKEYATDGSAMAQAQVLMTEMFDVDAVTGCSDAYRVSADLGAHPMSPAITTININQIFFTLSSPFNQSTYFLRLHRAVRSNGLSRRLFGLRPLRPAAGARNRSHPWRPTAPVIVILLPSYWLPSAEILLPCAGVTITVLRRAPIWKTSPVSKFITHARLSVLYKSVELQYLPEKLPTPFSCKLLYM